MNNINNLPRPIKIELLKAISSGEVNIKDLTPDAIIVSSGSDSFLGLLVAVSSKETGKGANVIFIGKGKKGLESIISNIKPEGNEK
jgi:hypothetical protein